MKRYIIGMIACVAGLLALAGCDDEREIGYKRLPGGAQSFIETYFPGREVIRAERERDDGSRDYKVLLDDGTELQFDESGRWENIDCNFSLLPDGILPEVISEHIASNYPGGTVHEVNREFGGYEISIGNGVELIYAADGSFVREERF